MKRNKAFVAIAALGLGVMAGAAQADALNGPYAGGGLSFIKGTVKLTDPVDSSTSVTLGTDKTDVGINLNGGYGMTVGGNFHLAGELSYQSAFGKAEGNLSGETATSKLKNVWALSFLPGYKLDNTTLAYGRLGYARAKNDINFPGESVSKTSNGILYGLGVKHAFTRNLAGVFEFQNLVMQEKTVTFSDGSTTKAKAGGSGFLLGVQYGF